LKRIIGRRHAQPLKQFKDSVIAMIAMAVHSQCTKAIDGHLYMHALPGTFFNFPDFLFQ